MLLQPGSGTNARKSDRDAVVPVFVVAVVVVVVVAVAI